MTAVWTAPRTWADAEVPDKPIMDQHIRDNLEYLEAGVRVYDSRGTILDKQVDATGVGNGADETSLLSYTVPANTLEDWSVLRVTATGRLVDNANAKKLVMRWGPLDGPSAEQPLDTGNNLTHGGNWKIRAWITQLPAGLGPAGSRQYGTAWLLIGDTAPAEKYQAVDRCWGYQDATGQVLAHVSGYSPAGANQVYGHTFLVELLRPPIGS